MVRISTRHAARQRWLGPPGIGRIRKAARPGGTAAAAAELALMREQAERIPPEQRDRVKLWANSLRDAFYEAEDILDIADYHRLHNQY
nr:unnamed protein product [Digitaria exilis]